ncbi:MAG: YraN family protein [Firmicutes bacterium]|nr:YraN family protein [Bacillota bacterium]
MSGPAVRRPAADRAVGRAGEDAAAEELTRRGYVILERNWRCRFGEIDMVAEHRGTLVFVEVKSRGSVRFGSGAEAVDARKQRRLVRLARAYLCGRGRAGLDTPCRFDVVAVDMSRPGRPGIDVIEDAFAVS